MYDIETLYEHRASLEQKLASLASPVLSEIFLPRLDRSWRADVLKTPGVSMAIGSKMYRPSGISVLIQRFNATLLNDSFAYENRADD